MLETVANLLFVDVVFHTLLSRALGNLGLQSQACKHKSNSEVRQLGGASDA